MGITAAEFFAKNYDDFSRVINALPNDSKYIENIKILFQKSTLPSDLSFINSYLSFLPGEITRLETRGLSLAVQLEVLDNVRVKIGEIRGLRGSTLRQKLDDIFCKNKGLMQLREMNDAVLHGATVGSTPIHTIISSAYKYAALNSVDVERSFSDYKLLLTDRRLGFTQENVEKHLSVMYNTKFLK